MGRGGVSCSLIHHGEGLCDGCGRRLTGRQARWCSRKCARAYVANHRFTQAKALIKAQNAFWQCGRCGAVVRDIEVNHIEPCNGQHSTWGCHHHQSNLELLCEWCHKEVTAAQAAERAAKRREEKK